MQTPRKYSVISLVLIGMSVLVAALSQLGASVSALTPLLIADPAHPGLTDVLHGQVWRLVTPIFVHFGIIHLLFNMLWVWDLSGLMERLKGQRFYVVFLLVLAVLSNLAQYLLAGSPFFGGMSGVVYGLLGYLWMQGQFNPNAGFALRQNTVLTMLGWFVLCWTGLLGPIANWAHTAGLLVGVVWGFIDARKGSGPRFVAGASADV